jgi:predicted DCC family thiol-disulfide oxidoreductase YuxK
VTDDGGVTSATGVDLPDATVFYDGVCGFCDREVQWLLGLDTAGRLHFAPLQGSTAAAVREVFPGSITGDLDTMVFAERDGDGVRFSYRSDAALRILTVADVAPWHRRLLRWTPRFLRELGYRFVARVRYRVWGRLDACRIPTPDQRQRFLD